MIPLFLHNTGCMAGVMGECWGLVGQKSGIVKNRLVSPLLFEHQMAEQRRFWDQIWGGKARPEQSLLDRTSVFPKEKLRFCVFQATIALSSCKTRRKVALQSI